MYEFNKAIINRSEPVNMKLTIILITKQCNKTAIHKQTNDKQYNNKTINSKKTHKFEQADY